MHRTEFVELATFSKPKEPKKAWNSDDEDVDEFGRKKKRRGFVL